MSSQSERSVRVSTLELFFDLVFVFTITQLTGVLVDGEDGAAFVQVMVMLSLDLVDLRRLRLADNTIATDRVRCRLLLLGGMGGFLVIALAVPHAYGETGSLRPRFSRRSPAPHRHVRRGDVRFRGARSFGSSLQPRQRRHPARRRRLSAGIGSGRCGRSPPACSGCRPTSPASRASSSPSRTSSSGVAWS